MLLEEKRRGRNILSFIGRILLSLIFIFSGIGKLKDWSGSITLMMSEGIPMPQFLLAVATALEIIGGLLLFFGWKSRFGALLLLIFLIPTTYLMHHFWDRSGPSQMMQMSMFMKNTAIIGGLFLVTAFGGGGWSFDRFCKKCKIEKKEEVEPTKKV